MNGNPAIDVRGVTKSFDGKKVVDDVALLYAPATPPADSFCRWRVGAIGAV